MRVAITDFGARPGQRGTLCTDAFARAVEACAATGGGVVIVPAGEFLTGAIRLKSNINLYLEPGAVVRFSRDEADYPPVVTRWEGRDCEVHSPMIYGENLENVSVTGFGTLDGQGGAWWERLRRGELRYPRPRLVGLTCCRRVTISDVRLINSPSWTVHPLLCDTVTVRNITIQNPPDSPNTDGINPESSRNVHISDCHIDVGDDCVTLKSGAEDCAERVSCENIAITNCTMVRGHGGVVIGSEMSGGVRGVVIGNCVFEGTDRGIRIKTRRGRGGAVEDIRVDNIIMKRVVCPIVMNMFYFCGPGGKERIVWDKNPYPVDASTPAFRRIHFSNITAREAGACAGFLYGLPEMPIQEVTLSGVDVEMAEGALPAMPAMMSGLEPMAGRGFFCRNARDIEFDHVSIRGHIGAAFDAQGCEGVRLPEDRL
jgi:polygalacturonase